MRLRLEHCLVTQTNKHSEYAVCEIYMQIYGYVCPKAIQKTWTIHGQEPRVQMLSQGSFTKALLSGRRYDPGCYEHRLNSSNKEEEQIEDVIEDASSSLVCEEDKGALAKLLESSDDEAELDAVIEELVQHNRDVS